MMEEKVREVILEELRRQAEARPSELRIEAAGEDLRIDGTIDLAAFAMAIVGSVAGGP